MWRTMWLGVVGTAALIATSAPAQGPGGKEKARNLEAQLEKLRDQIADLEAALKKAREPDRRPERGPESGPPGRGEGFGPKGFGPKGFGPKGFGAKGFGPKESKEMAEGKKKAGFDFEKKKDKGSWEGPSWAKKEGFGPAWAKKKGGWGKGPGGPPWMRGASSFGGAQWARSGFGRGPERGPGRDEGIERRLERLQEEIEGLRREIRRR